MGRGSLSHDAFSRGGAPVAGFLTPGKDHFREKAEKLAARKSGHLSGDAFATTARRAVAEKDAFGPPVETPRAFSETAFHPEPARKSRKLANGAALTVVASQPQAVKAELYRRDREKGAHRAAKSSSFVLVSSSNVIEATAPAAVAGDGGQGPLAIPSLSSPKFKPKGGGGGKGGGDDGAVPPRDRILNQDDLAGVLIVLAVLLMMALYLVNFFRGNGLAPVTDDEVLDVQTAATAPAAPPAPLPDPFGNQAVDLTPKSPLPPESAVIAAAPAPAAMPALDVRVQAYFCTDRSELTPASATALEEEIAAWGDRMAGKDLVVTGYADTRGEAVYNTWLGGERAKAVVNYLSARGFKATALAVGELPDLADNQNCANQRRVDVRLADAAEEAPSRSCAPPPELAALACLAEQPESVSTAPAQ